MLRGLRFEVRHKTMRSRARRHAVRVRALESMIRAGNGFELRRNTGRDESFDEPQRLFVSDISIDSAVNRKNRCGVRRHPVQRTGANVFEALMVQIAAEKFRQNFGGINRFRVGLREVRGSVFIHNTLHDARLIAIRSGAFEFLNSLP